ncbi:hypothetical protein ABLN72_12815, partial [Mycobacterium tuberculosis]
IASFHLSGEGGCLTYKHSSTSTVFRIYRRQRFRVFVRRFTLPTVAERDGRLWARPKVAEF